MKVLFIGGTGNISTACSKLALKKGHEVYILNRGTRKRPELGDARFIKADINNADQVKAAIRDLEFDVVANFIAFKPEEVERDIKLFSGKTQQYIFAVSFYQ